jgi:hypothetical protein
MTFAIIGSWTFSDGLNGIVVDHTNPFIHFMETKASQEITDGIIFLALGAVCFAAFTVLFLSNRKFLFPQDKQARQE